MKILILSTYPLVNPAHGGQHRLSQIAQAFERAGHTVECRGVLGSASYAATPGYLPYPGVKALSAYLPNPMLMEDWAIGKYAADRKGGFPKLSKLCGDGQDVIFCEQPWLFEFAFALAGARKRRPALVYGSQNVEHRLKYEIASEYLTAELAEKYSLLVEEVELFAATHADLNVAVSDHDEEWLGSVSDKPVVLAANGVVDRRASLKDVRRSNEITQCRKFALYCASSHPPNIQGFFDIFGDGVGCLAPDQRLVVAGGAGAVIASDRRFTRISGLASKFIASGEVSESVLSGLLATAHVILLPITRGGGTNLKTAEAIWAGRHVVGTKTSMRGFEQFGSARGVSVADGGPDFQREILAAMAEPALELTPSERKERAVVLWPQTLADLTQAIGQLGRVR